MLQICENLICPLCGAPLVREQGSLLCLGEEKRHTYDVSKEGYVNLLPPGRGKNAKTGDDAEMVRARRTFLSSGAYDPLSDEVGRIIADFMEDKSLINIVDSGCGEGHHTARYVKALAEGTSVLCAAFDASKHAAAAGAKSARAAGLSEKGGVGIPTEGKASLSFMTGNIFSLPIKSCSTDAVVSMFAPIAWEENSRILKDDGVIIVAASGVDHLREMREVIYDEVLTKDSTPHAPDTFVLAEERSVRYELELTSHEQIMNLFGMTPFCYRTPKAGYERLNSLESLRVTVHTDFFIYKKSV